MRIVLLDDKKPEREAMQRALAAAKYSAEGVADEAAALSAIMRESPQIVVFSVPAKGGADLVRRLKGADASNQAYLLALFDTAPSARDLAAVLEAGASDFFRRPVADVELLERLKGPARAMRWARAVATPAAFDLAAPVQVSRLQAWSALGQLVATDLAEMAGQPVAVSNVWPARFQHDLRGASIPMSLAGEQLELRVSIVADPIALRWIKATLLYDPNASAAAADDALRELANTAGGALKRAALAENVSLTTGIPNTDSPALPAPSAGCWTLTVDGSDCQLAVVGVARELTNERVASSKLTEGMVLAHDVRTTNGILLAPAGARLTATTAAKLAQMLGPRFYIEVAPPALS